MAEAKEDVEAERHDEGCSGAAEDGHSWSCCRRRWSKSTTRLLNSTRHAERRTSAGRWSV